MGAYKMLVVGANRQPLTQSVGLDLANRKKFIMKLRIVSEGEGKTTRIYTPDGEDISRHVRSVDIKITAGGLAVATVEMVNVSIDVSARSVSRQTKRALDAAIALKNWLARLFAPRQ